MAGAKLDFGNGWLGFERCIGDDGKQFLRAVIHAKSAGRTTSAAVELSAVAQFLKDALLHMALAHLNAETEQEIVEAELIRMADEIRAESALRARQAGGGDE